MTGDHHGRTARRATLLVTAADEILGTHNLLIVQVGYQLQGALHRIDRREAQLQHAALAAFVHVLLQDLDRPPARPDRVGGPGVRGQDDQRVEHVLVQPGSAGERVVPSLGGQPEATKHGPVGVHGMLEVGHAERYVSPLIAQRQAGHLPRHRVRCVTRDERQQVEEAPLAQHR
jgi:hypothetical protein